MAAHFVPHLANDQGAEKIFVGVKELNCMGARPPFDHPHVFLDMGSDGQILCPYCSTLFVYDARLGEHEGVHVVVASRGGRIVVRTEDEGLVQPFPADPEALSRLSRA